MTLTPYHAKYHAIRLGSARYGTIEKLIPVLSSADIEILPHQIEAAMRVFRNPYNKGFILCDEVGLGKAVEAGIIMAQRWYEGKQKILLVLPTHLVAQWQAELEDKFDLPVAVIDSKAATDELLKEGAENPYSQEAIVLTTYNFAAEQSEYIKEIEWDLCVFEEAHRLRKIYSGENKIAMALYEATKNRQKLLLTATPIHNSVMDIYGLINFIDDNIFIDDEVFYKRYYNNPENYDELSERIKNICFRTLRSDVAKYVKLTNRIPKTIEFELTEAERTLYDKLSLYLKKPKKKAFPEMQEYYLTLLILKTFSSSTFALTETLSGIAERLSKMPDAAEEYAEVNGIYELCKSITYNAKGSAFVKALGDAMTELKSKGAEKKALIFTENKTTQQYIYDLLAKSKYRGKVLMFNGSHSRDSEKIEQFKKDADILIATDIASEGFNFEFCSLVINYDLPWNIQKIEQRIGRCHRTGQKHDVLVVNFLNKNNYADVRFMELVTKRLRLIKGVFNQTDDLIGDFEDSVGKIMFNSRTKEDIDKAFDKLQADFAGEIKQKREKTKHDIIRSFDDSLLKKIEFIEGAVKKLCEEYNDTLWELSKFALGSIATLNDDDRSIMITKTFEGYHPRELFYKMDLAELKGRRYGVNNPLAKKVLDTLEFRKLYSGNIRCRGDKPFAATLAMYNVGLFTGNNYELYTRFVGLASGGDVLSHEDCVRLFSLPVIDYSAGYKDDDGEIYEYVREDERAKIDRLFEMQKSVLFDEMQDDNKTYVADEIAKITAFNEDKKQRLDADLERASKEINEQKYKQNRSADYEEKLLAQRTAAVAEKKKKDIEQSLFFEKMSLDAALEDSIENLRKNIVSKATVTPEFYVNIEVMCG